MGQAQARTLVALVLEANEELDRRGHTGPRICINSDLGVREWESTRPHCERLARHAGLPLVVASDAFALTSLRMSYG